MSNSGTHTAEHTPAADAQSAGLSAGFRLQGGQLEFTYSVLRIIALFVVWQLLVTWFSVPKYLVPAPSDVWLVFVNQWSGLWRAAHTTVAEMVGGFAFGSLFSIGFGLLVVYWRPARSVLLPYLVIFQAIPKVALAPLFIIWFGFGISTNILYTALIAFFPVLINFMQGLEDVNENERKLMASYNASKWQMFRHLHLYRSLPYLFAGLKMAAILSLIGAVVSEFVAGDRGLGYFMVQAQSSLRTSQAFAALTALTILGYGFYLAIELLHRWLTPWSTQHSGDGRGAA